MFAQVQVRIIGDYKSSDFGMVGFTADIKGTVHFPIELDEEIRRKARKQKKSYAFFARRIIRRQLEQAIK